MKENYSVDFYLSQLPINFCLMENQSFSMKVFTSPIRTNWFAHETKGIVADIYISRAGLTKMYTVETLRSDYPELFMSKTYWDKEIGSRLLLVTAMTTTDFMSLKWDSQNLKIY